VRPLRVAGHARGNAREDLEAAAIQRFELVQARSATPDHTSLTRSMRDFLYSTGVRLLRTAEAFEVGEPDLHEGPYRILEAGFTGRREGLLVALAHLLRRDALLEPVVTGDQEPLDLRPRVVSRRHGKNVAVATIAHRMVQVFAVLQVLLSAGLVALVLMHSGRDTGFGGIGFTPASQGGTHIVERNLTRLTVVIAVLFGVNTVVLFRVLE
jgi:preprotein translocase subunit SecG